MKLRDLGFSMILLVAPALSAAFTPENGFYNLFSSDAKGGEGTGLAVEIQNDYLFAAGFVFRPDGASAYVTIEGPLQHRADGSWGLHVDQGLATYSGGQCIGSLEHCPYRTPAMKFIGSFSIEFTTENEGRLEWGADGDRALVALRRTCVGSICYDAPSSLLGEWDVILDGVGTNGLRYGGDKLAIANVSPTGDLRTIGGCVALSENAPPDCAGRVGRDVLDGNAQRCLDRSCFGTYRYVLAVHAATCRQALCKIVRVYTFNENGKGGAFGGTIRSNANLCPTGADSVAACAAIKNVPFVAYRSASVNFVRTGVGTN